MEAEELLMQPFNSLGSFMVRYSETTPGTFSLSIRDREKVRHYHILSLEEGTLSITRQVMFETLQELVAHHSQQADGLFVNLKQPCLTSAKLQIRRHTNEEWEIGRHQIQLVHRLGVGQFGEVWEGLWNNTSVAVKVLDSGSYQDEVGLMKKIHHQNLIQLYGVCTKEEPIYIITELMKHGSLMEYLQGEGTSLKLPQLINMSAQIASGMAYLEERNYIHRDLAARNILVGDHMTCKVAHFGLAQDLTENIYDMPIDQKLPIKWMAPEAAMYDRFTSKSDVWSFGIVIYEIITYGKVPYPGMTNGQVLKVLQQGYRMPRPMECPNELYDIMLDCWKEDPAERPTFETLHHHLKEFFTTNDGGYREPE